jgi:transketolase
LVPSDIETTRGAVKAMLDYEGPVYLRLSRDSVSSCHQGDETFTIGKAKVLKDGYDLTLAVSGTLLPAVLAAAEELAGAGIDVAVVEFPTLKPLDSQTLMKYAQQTGAVITVEEHTIIGGLGSAVAEALSEEYPVKLHRIGIADSFGESGPYAQLLDKYGLSTPHIVKAAQQLLRR